MAAAKLLPPRGSALAQPWPVGYEPRMPDLQTALAALRTVQDPELRRDLVSLNMVKDLAVDGSTVSLKVELTTPACPLKGTIQRDVEAVLHGVGFAEV
jgi:ATP-binding protein involved in chromosome partitioning